MFTKDNEVNEEIGLIRSIGLAICHVQFAIRHRPLVIGHRWIRSEAASHADHLSVTHGRPTQQGLSLLCLLCCLL